MSTAAPTDRRIARLFMTAVGPISELSAQRLVEYEEYFISHGGEVLRKERSERDECLFTFREPPQLSVFTRDKFSFTVK
ncbi:hypothetical protein AB6A40_001126 [Gnathostoma spinigerum]|uniref:Uncharacterized protein n=1 Tax=Gnathostoma spinigerum TaxID=75299 RepID=A0ABD6ECK4_9BILA